MLDVERSGRTELPSAYGNAFDFAAVRPKLQPIGGSLRLFEGDAI